MPVVVFVPEVSVPTREIFSPIIPLVPEVAVLVIEYVEPEVASVPEEKMRLNVESASKLNVTLLVPDGVNVLSPVNVWVDSKSARVIVPGGIVAVVLFDVDKVR